MLSGGTAETTQIDPILRVYHDCNDVTQVGGVAKVRLFCGLSKSSYLWVESRIFFYQDDFVIEWIANERISAWKSQSDFCPPQQVHNECEDPEKDDGYWNNKSGVRIPERRQRIHRQLNNIYCINKLIPSSVFPRLQSCSRRPLLVKT